jgi:hypothetical protein
MLERHVIRHGSAVIRGECRSGWRITAERDQRGFVERRRHQTSWFLGDGKTGDPGKENEARENQ